MPLHTHISTSKRVKGDQVAANSLEKFMKDSMRNANDSCYAVWNGGCNCKRDEIFPHVPL